VPNPIDLVAGERISKKLRKLVWSGRDIAENERRTPGGDRMFEIANVTGREIVDDDDAISAID
jgi:hypothetical protein